MMSLTLGSFYAPIMTNLMAVRENCFDDILAPPFFFAIFSLIWHFTYVLAFRSASLYCNELDKMYTVSVEIPQETRVFFVGLICWYR